MSHTHIQHWPSVWRTCIIDVYPDFFSFTSILTSYENARKRLKQHFLTTRTNNLWLYFFQKGIVFTKRRISNFIAPNKPRKWLIPFKTHVLMVKKGCFKSFIVEQNLQLRIMRYMHVWCINVVTDWTCSVSLEYNFTKRALEMLVMMLQKMSSSFFVASF